MGRPRSDIGPRIVHAARARFLAEGVDGASLRTIAADAKTSIGMVYYYFPTKDDLFHAVVEEVYGALLQDLEVAVLSATTVDERLRRASTRIGRASELELDVVRLVLREALVSSSRLERLFARFTAGHIALLGRTLLEGVREGAIDASVPPPLLLLSTLAMIALPQLLGRALGAGGRAPALVGVGNGEELARQMVELLLHGIAPRADAAGPRSAPAAPRAAPRRPRTPRP